MRAGRAGSRGCGSRACDARPVDVNNGPTSERIRTAWGTAPSARSRHGASVARVEHNSRARRTDESRRWECRRKGGVPTSCGTKARIHRYRSLAVSMRHRRQDDAGDQEVAELAALADGSLAPKRRAALEARVAESPRARRPACRAGARGRARARRRGRGRGAGAPAGTRGGATAGAPRRRRVAWSVWPAQPRLLRRPSRSG